MPGAIFLASRVALMSGVLPSPNVMMGVCSVTGRNFRYSSITPRQRFIALFVLAFNPDQDGGRRDTGHAIDLAESCLDIPLLGHMGLNDDRDRLSSPSSLLQHRRDADAKPAEFSRDLCQYAGSIYHHETEIVERADLIHGAHPQWAPLIRLERSGRNPSNSPLEEIASEADDVAHDRTPCRQVAGTSAIQHHVADRIAHQLNRVINAFHFRDRRGRGNHRRVNAGFNLAVDELRDAQEFDRVAELRSEERRVG